MATTTRPEIRATGYIGRTPDGERVWLEIRLSEQDGGERSVTTEHEPAPETFYRLSISGLGKSKGRRIVDHAGQMTNTFAELAKPGAKLDKAWTATEVRRIVEIWDRWHLNDTSGACAHQTVWNGGSATWQTEGSNRLRFTKRCPLTGYRYGHAWLIELLPDDVLAEVHAFMAKLDGDRPA